jgi:hypothetical protein
MSIAKHHNEWLSLIDISGPFLSLKVLTDTFPQGLPAVTSEMRSDLRAAYDEWADNQSGFQPDEAIHRAWFEFVFADLLGYTPSTFVNCAAGCPPEWQAVLAERQISLRPDFALRRSKEAKPRLLIMTLPSRQGLEKRSKEAYSPANEMTPATQMLELLRATGVPLGLVSNGAEWMLVYTAPGETASYATWRAELWLDEPVTLNAFYALLELGRFFGVPDDATLPALLAASKDNQHDVTDQLGIQVRHAVEILVQAIARADADQRGKLLADISEQTIYEAALVVMMRLVFLLSAEEQGLLLLGTPLYDQHYAISTLRAQLREAADRVGEEVIQRRTDAWARLLATFRAVYSGVWHEQLGLPAYGGALFDPHRFPFLEGRTGDEAPGAPVTPLQIDNRTVLHLLQALQQLELKVGGVTTLRTLSFRALDVEQIGHVYEGLLDHRAVRATEVVLGLEGAGGLEPEIPLATLETETAKGETALLDFLAAATKRSKAALARALAGALSDWRHGRFLTACGGAEQLLARILPFAGLVRDDTRDEPQVILPGAVYVTAGLTRRQTGSHYTPRSLTEPIVQHTLEPLVYVGPAEGLPRARWRLRSAAEILQLKVCDMTMGSGALLVAACRYLAERLLEAWEAEDTVAEVAFAEAAFAEVASSDATRRDGRRASSDARLLNQEPTPDRPFAGPFAAQNLDELYTLAKRLVAERCLYGVDKNPLAVEIAKLSLWLVTLSKSKPFTFLNHALRHGDSLIGAEEDGYNRWWHSLKGTVGPLYAEENEKALHEARRLRRELQTMQVLDVADAQRKAELLAAAERATAKIQRACDLLVGVQLLGLSQTEQETWRQKLLIEHVASEALDSETMSSPEAKQALTAARQHDAFHWFVEFPEVFAQGGFSAFMGNPPFLGGKRISSEYGQVYHNFIKLNLTSVSGSADLCAYFFIRASSFLKQGGTTGLLATNTIAQGDTREVGLDQLLKISQPCEIYLAINTLVWPGDAAVFVSLVHLFRGKWKGTKTLDGKEVSYISSFLDPIKDIGVPYVLEANQGISHMGSNVYGAGFRISEQHASEIIAQDQKYETVLFPFLNGIDINTHPEHKPPKWVINFHDWPLVKAQQYDLCMDIVEEHVYPIRAKSKRKPYRENWWQFAERQSSLYAAIQEMDRCLAIALTSNTLAFAFVETGVIFSNATIVIAFDDYAFTLLGPENMVQLMLDRQEGLTATYNRFHDPAETAEDIAHLRRLHLEMDQAVAAAYGWSDLALDHGFHETAQGLRYTISEPARREVLTRLLQLNHQRYEEEVAAGLHEKGKKSTQRHKEAKATKRKARTKKDKGQMPLF